MKNKICIFLVALLASAPAFAGSVAGAPKLDECAASVSVKIRKNVLARAAPLLTALKAESGRSARAMAFFRIDGQGRIVKRPVVTTTGDAKVAVTLASEFASAIRAAAPFSDCVGGKAGGRTMVLPMLLCGTEPCNLPTPETPASVRAWSSASSRE